MDGNEILTVNEVAEYLRMNPMTIYRFAQQGQIPASKIMGSWRFKRSEIDEWIKSREVQSSKILVIDDDPEIGKRIKKILERKHQVILTETSEETMRTLGHHKFSLIFLDLSLPDIDGLTLYKQLKNREFNVPVVVITGSTDGALLGRALADGVQFILNKPFSDDEVRQMLSFIKV